MHKGLNTMQILQAFFEPIGQHLSLLAQKWDDYPYNNNLILRIFLNYIEHSQEYVSEHKIDTVCELWYLIKLKTYLKWKIHY